MKLQTIHSTKDTLATIKFFVYSCKHDYSCVASYIHACTNKTHSIANLQDLIPTLASLFMLPIIIAAKVGIKSSRFAFVHAWM